MLGQKAVPDLLFERKESSEVLDARVGFTKTSPVLWLGNTYLMYNVYEKRLDPQGQQDGGGVNGNNTNLLPGPIGSYNKIVEKLLRTNN